MNEYVFHLAKEIATILFKYDTSYIYKGFIVKI